MSYNKLFFNRLSLTDDSTVDVNLNFRCPVCEGRPDFPKVQAVPKFPNGTVNVNAQVLFTMPCCQTRIRLYVAVHRSNQLGADTRVSTVPILDEWWMT